jgi:hypothetical protein
MTFNEALIVTDPYVNLKMYARISAEKRDLRLYKKKEFDQLDKNTIKWIKQKLKKKHI